MALKEIISFSMRKECSTKAWCKEAEIKWHHIVFREWRDDIHCC